MRSSKLNSTVVNGVYQSLFNRLTNALFSYTTNTGKVQERAKSELDILISEANKTLHQPLIEPFLAWMMSYILALPVVDENTLGLLNYLSYFGLLFNKKIDYMGKKVSLLSFSSQFKHVSVVKWLIEELNVTLDASEPIHPIAISSMKNNTAVTQYLIENMSLYSKDLPLTMTVRYGYKKLLSRFIESGEYDINQPDTIDRTPLMHAMIQGKLDMVTDLLASGAMALAKSRGGQTILHVMFESPDVAFIDHFIDKYPEYHDALYNPTSEWGDQQGLYPIHHAIQHHKIDWVKRALINNPRLAQLVDDAGRSLAFHAVMAGEQSLLTDLHEKGLSLLDLDSNNYSLLDYCIDYEQISLANWLIEQPGIDINPIKLSTDSPLCRAVYGGKKQMIAWCLSQPSIDLNKTYVKYKITDNLASLLIKYWQVEFVVEFDLYRKNPRLLFERLSFNNTSLDEFINMIDIPNFSPDDVRKTRAFMQYVVNYLRENQDRPSVSLSNNFKEISVYCLDNQFISADEGFGEPVPLLHQWEFYFYNQYKQFMQNGFRSDSSQLAEEKFAREALGYYQGNIQLLVDTYKPALNVKDVHGSHLFATLMKKGMDGSNRIQWLFTHILGFVLTDLDKEGSSLLHLACEQQNMDMIRWSHEVKGLSLIKPRKDGLSALDISLNCNNKAICTYLIGQLNNKQWALYLNALQESQAVDRLVQLEQNKFYGRAPKNVTQTQTRLLAENPALLVEDLPKKDATLSEIEISYEQLLEAISTPQLAVIKELKHEKYQLRLQIAIDNRVVSLIQACDYKYAIIYQLIRITVFKQLLEPHWKQVYQDVIQQNNTRILSLFLNQAMGQSQWIDFGFDLLQQAVALKHLTMVLMLLDKENIAATAHHQGNRLLLDTTKQGSTQIVLKLLSLNSVAALADIIENEPLKGAANANDLESCEALLQLPCVIESLRINDYELVKEVMDNDFEDLIILMRAIPEIESFIERTYPDAESTQEVNAPESGGVSLDDVALPQEHSLVYFYNPNYYVTMINEHDFYDAIICGDTHRFDALFFGVPQLNPAFILNLASFAVMYGQCAILQRLVDMARPVFNSNPVWCNQMLCQAMRAGQGFIVNALLQSEPMQTHLDMFNNRLLRCAIHYGFIEQALYLLTFQSVQHRAHTIHNYALRHSAARGYPDLVRRLLTCSMVCADIGAFKHYSLRKAFQAGHFDIVQILFSAQPRVLKYAIQKNGLYDACVFHCIDQLLKDWKKSNIVLNQSQHDLLALLKEYPVTQRIVSSFINDYPSRSSLLSEQSFFQPVAAYVSEYEYSAAMDSGAHV